MQPIATDEEASVSRDPPREGAPSKGDMIKFSTDEHIVGTVFRAKYPSPDWSRCVVMESKKIKI